MSDLGHGQRCSACGTTVRDDLVDHAFFGFSTGCARAEQGEPRPGMPVTVDIV
jgi:hypothetical protein